MSDDFHRPTLTFPAGVYNASQVRLYGLPGSGGLVFPGKSMVMENNPVNFSTNISTGKPSDDKKINAQIKEIIGRIENDSDAELEFFKENSKSSSSPFPYPTGFSFQISLDMRKFGSIVLSTVITLDEAAKQQRLLSCGIIVGYSYEGHCYDLPKPKIMLLPTFPEDIPRDDCGYDKKNDRPPNPVTRYKLWIVDKLDECVEFEMNQGFVEQLVLDANLPGKRSPTMYASRMMMGHRGGRLGES